jgi:L-threonylcarbamoyladenylate synthase
MHRIADGLVDEGTRAEYASAFEILRSGGVVALPTDTVYGLCALATDDGAVQRLYEIKGRPDDQPLPLFVASIAQAELIIEFNPAARQLAERYWPGALTIVASKRPTFGTLAAAGGDTIGVRSPLDAVLREFAAQLGPITGTSANLSGKPECHSAAAVRAQLDGAVDVIVDAPVAATGQASTVVDCSDAREVRMIREGEIGRQQIAGALAGVSRLR